jgi:PIN domain nuclease of toxin-antitoxin system
VDDAPQLTEGARAAMGATDQVCFVSLASCWEIAIKVRLGKLTVEFSLERFVAEQMAINGFQPLAITLRPRRPRGRPAVSSSGSVRSAARRAGGR